MEIKKMKIGDMGLAPVKPRKLCRAAINSVEEIEKLLDDVYNQAMDEWLDGFYRDLTPEREIAIWQLIAKIYRKHADQLNAELEVRQAIFETTLAAANGMDIEDIRSRVGSLLNNNLIEEIFYRISLGKDWKNKLDKSGHKK